MVSGPLSLAFELGEGRSVICAIEGRGGRTDGWTTSSEPARRSWREPKWGRIVEAEGIVWACAVMMFWGMSTCDVYSGGSSGNHLK